MQTGYKSLRNNKRVTKRTNTRTQGKRRVGRLPGSKNKKTAERELLLKKGGMLTNGKLAVEIMDEEIASLEELARTLYPWDAEGKQLKGKSVQAFYWASELRRDYLALRAPYQSPRLSAVQVIPAGQQRAQTMVNVTILNERGEQEYSDAPEGDAKLIEHDPERGTHGEEAA